MEDESGLTLRKASFEPSLNEIVIEVIFSVVSKRDISGSITPSN
jgi:hypothetical protein